MNGLADTQAVYQIVRSDGMIYGAPTSRYSKRGSGQIDRWHKVVGKFYTYRAVTQLLKGWDSRLRAGCTVIEYHYKESGRLDVRTFISLSKGQK